jgi:hypothetical protein
MKKNEESLQNLDLPRLALHCRREEVRIMPRKVQTQKSSELLHIAGPVADPGPELILDKDRLARLKLEMLGQEILELKNQIKIAETYQVLIKEQHNIK